MSACAHSLALVAVTMASCAELYFRLRRPHGWWATAALAMATSRTAAHASFSKAWLLWPLRSAVLNQNPIHGAGW